MKTKTFISTSPIHGCHYPQKSQSQVIRAYCIDQELSFSLPITEQNGFVEVIINQILNEDLSHLICFSIDQLSKMSFAETKALQAKVEGGLILHFALENIKIESSEDFKDYSLKNRIFKTNAQQLSLIDELKEYKGKKTNFITNNHLKSSRNYQERATDDKADLANIAKKFDFDYWDGSRNTGYGGYHDDGRWESVAQNMIEFYKLDSSVRILDIGCGKGYLLKEFKKLLPLSEVYGIDVSAYALEHAAPEVKSNLFEGNAIELPFENDSFDLVVSNMTLHNLLLPDLKKSLKEINRVSRGKSWLGVEAYTTQEQKWNLMRWQLTCECFFTPEEWISIFQETSYDGDYELIYFD